MGSGMEAIMYWFFALCASSQPNADVRIIGGYEATNIPFIVPFIWRGWAPYCSGSIIHEKWVVTAAHCFENISPSTFYVPGGAHDWTDTAGLQTRDIKAFHIHEAYNNISLENDIALAELESPFCLNEEVSIIEVATEDDPYEVGQEYTVAGWGAMNTMDYDPYFSDYPDLLQMLDGMPQVDADHCDIVLQGWFNRSIQICAGAVVGEDTCVGDSGGPLWRSVDSNPVLYGLTSWGFGCANGIPGVYTRLSKFNDWIESTANIASDLGHFIVQGKDTAKCLAGSSCAARAVHAEESWNVRCCADTDPGGWLKRCGCPVYTNSEVPDCYTTNYNEAVRICSDAGGRLCTKEELESPNLCSAGGGCNYNYQMVWSSTVGMVSPSDSQYFIAKGSSSSRCTDTTDSTCTAKYVGKYEQYGVRCCADEDPGGWIQQSQCSVYTESNVPKCYVTDWDSAAELCSTAGGRLCTREELESNCARGGGCSLNTKMVWSSDKYFDECLV